MDDTRIHHLLGHHIDGGPFSFVMDLRNKKCSKEEIEELLLIDYIEPVYLDNMTSQHYKVSFKGLEYLRKPLL